MKRLALVAAVVMSSVQGCATASLTPAGAQVQVVSERKAIESCRFVSVVETDQSLARSEMIAVLRNAAAEVEADTLLVPSGVGVFGGMIREAPHVVVRTADAYRCTAD